MYGAVIGDVVGSVFEWHNIFTKEFPLFSERGKFTDSTILTMAAADWCMSGGSPEEYLLKWCDKYSGSDLSGHDVYRKELRDWLENTEQKINYPDANGAVMRISPIPFLLTDREEALERAMEFTLATHDHPASVRAVRAYVTAIHDIYDGMDTENIKRHIAAEFSYNTQRPFGSLRYKRIAFMCNDTVSEAIICALDAESFEDALRNAVSLGGDSPTMACMTGALAEALFGIPMKTGTECLGYLDEHVREVLNRLYSAVPKENNYFGAEKEK